MESSSPESQINTRLLRSGYHHVCSKQWQGNSSCVNMMLLQLRFSKASSSGSTSIITRWTSSFLHQEAIVKAQRHVSLQIFLQHLFFLPSIMFTCPRNSLYGGGHCIPMSHESSLENSCPNVQLIHTVHSAVLRHMLLGILVQPCSHGRRSSWVIRSLMLVIRKTFSSFDLFLSSESYSSRVSPIMHQANLSCSSVLT